MNNNTALKHIIRIYIESIYFLSISALQGYFFYVILSYYKQKKAEALEKLQVAQFDNVEQGLYPKINEQKNFQ